MTDSKELKVLELDPERWLRGQKDSALLKQDGRMCCLGFLALACGAREADIIEEAMPSDAVGVAWPTELLVDAEGRVSVRDSRTCKNIADLNDDATIDDETRVEALTPLFERLGYRLEVKNQARVETLEPERVKP